MLSSLLPPLFVSSLVGKRTLTSWFIIFSSTNRNMFFSTSSHFVAGLRLHIVTLLLFWVFFFVNPTAAREEKLCKFPCKSRYAVFIHTATNDSLIEKLHLVFPTAHHRNLFSSNASPSPTSLPTHPSPSTFPQRL